jgi:hypothetical protein
MPTEQENPEMLYKNETTSGNWFQVGVGPGPLEITVKSVMNGFVLKHFNNEYIAASYPDIVKIMKDIFK